MGTEPEPWNFPVRNRIIAGLARIVCVVEAAEKSGSLITARCATGYGRDVAAVPGSILSPGAFGSNALLKDGAILVRNADDLLQELPEEERRRLRRSVPEREAIAIPDHLSPDAAALLAGLDADEPRDADTLLRGHGTRRGALLGGPRPPRAGGPRDGPPGRPFRPVAGKELTDVAS